MATFRSSVVLAGRWLGWNAITGQLVTPPPAIAKGTQKTAKK
jgi:hypothetical protein